MGRKKAPHLLSISVYSFDTKWETISNKFQELCTTSSAVWHSKTFDTWIAVLHTELWCQRISTPGTSFAYLCITTHPGHVSFLLLTICSLLPIFWACQLLPLHPPPTESILVLISYSPPLLFSPCFCHPSLFHAQTHTHKHTYSV